MSGGYVLLLACQTQSLIFELGEQKKTQAIIIGGDMLPIHGPFKYSLQEQQNFIFSYLEPKIQDFRSRVPQSDIYAMLGNDDWQASNAHLETLAKRGIVRLLHGEKHELGSGYELVGYAHVPPTPFTIKDGERRDLLDDAVVGQRHSHCRCKRALL